MAGGDSDRFDKYYNDKFLNELRFRGMNGDNESAKLYLMHMNGGIVPDALKAELDSKERMDAARNAAEIKAAEVRGQGMGPGAEIEALMRMPPEQLGIIERLRGLAPGSLSKPAAPGALGSIPPDASLSQVRGAIEQGGLMDGEGGMGQVRDFMNERFPGQVREQYESMQPGFMGRHGLSPWGREDADANMRLLERLFPEMFNPATAQ
jgi:hypothetical protein